MLDWEPFELFRGIENGPRGVNLADPLLSCYPDITYRVKIEGVHTIIGQSAGLVKVLPLYSFALFKGANVL